MEKGHGRMEIGRCQVLDIVFRENEQRKRNKCAAENFLVARKIALNLLKKDTKTKASLVSKRLKAGWHRDYLIGLLKL